MAIEKCKLSDVPELAVNVPTKGTHGYEGLFQKHHDHWQEFGQKAVQGKYLDVVREDIGRNMARLLANVLEGRDLLDLMHADDPGESTRLHRLALMAMSFFLIETITPNLVLVDARGSGSRKAAVLNVESLAKGLYSPEAYQIYLPGTMPNTPQWFRGANGLFICKSPSEPNPNVSHFLLKSNKDTDLKGMTVTMPYLASA